MRVFWIFLITLLSTVGALAQSSQDEVIRLQLKWFHQFQFAGYYAAEAEGFYAEEGLRVTIIEGGVDRSPIPMVLAGEADFGVGDSDILLARMRGDPLVVGAAIFQHSPYVLLTRRDRGIRTPADLVGATVMLSDDQGAAQLRAMVAKEGIDINTINVRTHSWALNDLIEGRADAVSAYATVEPWQLEARGVEPFALRGIDYGVDFYGDTLFTTEAEVAERPRQTAAFLRASLRGWQFAMANPEAIIDLILQMPGVAERGVTRELLQREAEEMEQLILPTLVDIGHMNPGRWQRIADTYGAVGLAPAGFSVKGFLMDPEPESAWIRRNLVFAMLLILVIAMVVAVWNLQMRRRVKERTRELEQQVRHGSQVERELIEAEEQFRLLAENINEVLWITDARRSRAIYLSPSFERIWGMSSESVLKSVESWIDSIHPSDRAAVAKASVEMTETGRFHAVYRIVRPDGEERWINDEAHAVRGKDGEIHRLVGVARDITKRRVAESKLLEQASILDETRDAIFVQRFDGRITFWNQAAERLYGWPASEAIGRMATDLLYSGVEVVSQAGQQVRQRGVWDGEIFHYDRHGEPLITAARWTRIGLTQGEDARVLCINTDVTQKKRLEQQFMRIQRIESIGTLASGIAHDLNNMLAPILMSIALLRLRYGDNPQVARQLDQLSSNTERGALLVRQLLTFGRGMESSRMVVQLKHIGREIAHIVEETFPKNIDFEFIFGPDLWCVQGVPTQLHQVLLNLCLNARDAMPDGGALSLQLGNATLTEEDVTEDVGATAGNYVRITVADAGCGIPAKIRDKIFDPFFSTKAEGKGTGLGLSTTMAIVRNHEGFIRLSSGGEGMGTTFTVFIPAHREVAEAAVTEGGRVGLPRGQGEMVLVVDDEKPIREIARLILERFGYRVLLAENGTDAVAQYSVHRDQVAVVVTDMAMPIMDGSATIMALRSMNPKVRIIASSGQREGEEDSTRQHVDGFVPKPYTAETLLQAVRQVVDRENPDAARDG